jgi:hypothetical protein
VLVGAADIFANHPFLVIGSGGTPDLEEVDWDDESPAWTDGEHLLVGTFGRAGLVRVTIWESAMPLIGEVVFDGQLEVAGSQLSIGDLEELTRFTMQVGESGPQRIVVCVDDPGYASRVSIGFDLGEQVATLTSAAGHPLPPVLLSAKGELSWSEEFGLILDGHDAPRARLAAAIKLMPVPGLPAAPDDEELVSEEELVGEEKLVGEKKLADEDKPAGGQELAGGDAANDVRSVTADSSDADDEIAEDADDEGVAEDAAVDVSRLVEWLRGLSGGIRLADAEACGEMIADRMRAAGPEGAGLPDDVALAIAADTLERLELR